MGCPPPSVLAACGIPVVATQTVADPAAAGRLAAERFLQRKVTGSGSFCAAVALAVAVKRPSLPKVSISLLLLTATSKLAKAISVNRSRYVLPTATALAASK